MTDYFVKVMPQADEDLEDIAYFIALDSPKRSQKFVAELVDAFKKLLEIFPESGKVYKGEIRQFTHKSYTAFYRTENSVKVCKLLIVRQAICCKLLIMLDSKKFFGVLSIVLKMMKS